MGRKAKEGKAAKPPASALERAVRLLASRRQTESELRRKLMQRGYETPEIEAALKRLKELKYVDDATAAHDWADELARLGGQGRLKAQQKLMQRGLDASLASREVERAWTPELEREHAQRSLAHQLKLSPALASTRKGRAKLWRSLMNRGYDTDIIRDLLAALPGTGDDETA